MDITNLAGQFITSQAAKSQSVQLIQRYSSVHDYVALLCRCDRVSIGPEGGMRGDRAKERWLSGRPDRFWYGQSEKWANDGGDDSP